MNTVIQLPAPVPSQASPYYIDNKRGYSAWRDKKLDGYPTTAGSLVVNLGDPLNLEQAETASILGLCRKTNMCIYKTNLAGVENKNIPRSLGNTFGLKRLDPNMLADDDGITSLTVVEGKSIRGYIPYSNRRLLWHTDGYYNSADRQIRAIILHCVNPAPDGGMNSLLDHEIAYLLLRDKNPDYVAALMAPDAMTIPANEETTEEQRLAVTGPVFSVDSVDGSLHMRYTARTRSIIWKDDDTTRKAVAYLTDIMENGHDYVFDYTLGAGEGVICNNVLHKRTAFENDGASSRLLYRARYYDRIRDTGLEEQQTGQPACYI